MKKMTIRLGGLFAAALLFTSCGDSDMLNGAKAHGEDIGTQTCKCAKATPEEAQACADELMFLTENYSAFLETAKGEGENIDELKKAYDEAFKEAVKSCE